MRGVIVTHAPGGDKDGGEAVHALLERAVRRANSVALGAGALARSGETVAGGPGVRAAAGGRV